MAEKTKGIQGMKVIPDGERKCIWMDAGVISYKLCTNRYQCTSCDFDQAMSGQVRKSKVAAGAAPTVMTQKKQINEWMEEFRHLPADQRKCRYMLMGEVSHKICPNSFRCGDCTFDQMMQDRIQPAIASNMETYPNVAGFFMPDNVYYFRNHTWLYLERMGQVRIGIDDFARRLIGKVNSIALPAVGKSVEFEEYTWSINHELGKLEFFSPIEGVVNSVNQKLLETPHLITDQPYSDGWLITIDPTSIRKGLKNLLKDKEAEAWMQEESDHLKESIFADAGAALQDGAVLTSDFSSSLSPDQWNVLVKKHLFVR